MPVTTVQKMIGAISMRMSLMKASPSGPIWLARSGAAMPSAIPSAMAISTQAQSLVHQAFFWRVTAGAPGVAVTVILPKASRRFAAQMLVFPAEYQDGNYKEFAAAHFGNRAMRPLGAGLPDPVARR